MCYVALCDVPPFVAAGARGDLRGGNLDEAASCWVRDEVAGWKNFRVDNGLCVVVVCVAVYFAVDLLLDDFLLMALDNFMGYGCDMSVMNNGYGWKQWSLEPPLARIDSYLVPN